MSFYITIWLFLGLALVSGKDFDYWDFGTVKMPTTPLQREEKEERMFNVLVSSLLMGSGKKVTEAVAVDFSKT